MNKHLWFSGFIIALLSVSLFAVAISNQSEVKNLQEKLANTKQELSSLQQNYTEQQQQFEKAFSPQIVAWLGEKVLTPHLSLVPPFNDSNEEYLWVTGEVHNLGYAEAYNVTLFTYLYTTNSTQPLLNMEHFNSIDPLGVVGIREAYYAPSNSNILSWTINYTYSDST